jgi:alanyl-tRNA synthetase
MSNATIKYYYIEPYLKELNAKVIDIIDNKIVLDKTIAYAEGGGQESDRGVFVIGDREIEFYDVQKGVGKSLYLENFPVISVETPIYHYINSKDLKYFKKNQEVKIKIDTLRRAKLSISHSAIHFVLMVIEKRLPGYENRIYGAKIKEDGARLDFKTTLKFDANFIKSLEDEVNLIVSKNLPIKNYTHKKHQEAWYWECNGYICPCGGTHIDNSKYIKKVFLKRKNLGKNGQRVSLTYEANDFFQDRFYSEAKSLKDS